MRIKRQKINKAKSKKAKELIDIAKKAGADTIKFQTWITEEIVTKTVGQAEYQTENTGINESQYEMLSKLEISFEDFRKLKEYADEREIIFMSTPDDEKIAGLFWLSQEVLIQSPVKGTESNLNSSISPVKFQGSGFTG